MITEEYPVAYESIDAIDEKMKFQRIPAFTTH